MPEITPRDLVGLTVWGEARGEPVEGKIAVANVIRNRLKSGRWGHTYKSVVLARLQFSCWSPLGGKANHARLRALEQEILDGKAQADPTVLECLWVADGCLSGAMSDNTLDATHYYSWYLKKPPQWAVGHEPTAAIGGHLFFAGIR